MEGTRKMALRDPRAWVRRGMVVALLASAAIAFHQVPVLRQAARFRRAAARMDEGRWDEAARLLGPLCRTDGGAAAAARFNCALALYRAGRWAEAAGLIDSGGRGRSALLNASGALVAGNCAARLGHKAQAAARYSSSIAAAEDALLDDPQSEAREVRRRAAHNLALMTEADAAGASSAAAAPARHGPGEASASAGDPHGQALAAATEPGTAAADGPQAWSGELQDAEAVLRYALEQDTGPLLRSTAGPARPLPQSRVPDW
jgi:tetratricopeptide (TPR) repeat protein